MTKINSSLYTANFAFDAPFQLNLSEGQVFYAEKVVRIIPKRRMVAFGIWQDKPVVAKIFFDMHRAKQHMAKDTKGVHILQENKIPTPTLYYNGISEDKRSHVLLFERIFDAKNIEEIWNDDKKNFKALLPQLRAIMIELATQHVFGVLQHDLHLKNFLLTEKTVYTLDGAQIELFPKMLEKKQSMNNIALFLSQLGAGVEEYQVELFRYYAKARGWLIKKKDTRELFLLIKKWNDKRWQKYEKKIFRDCSDFSHYRGWKSIGMYDRKYAAPEFLQLINHPESAFEHSSAKILKAGRSSTVVKVVLDQREFVIKRYNIKNAFHYLRRCFRSTRGASSWRLAQKLKLFHIPTAAPVAFIENRCLGLRGKSYYVTEYVPGEHAGDFFIHHCEENDKISDMIKRITALLKNLSRLGISHGDLKLTNILIDIHEQPLLIDLDGATEHTSSSRLRKVWHKELRRFLRNFIDRPLMQERFKNELNILNEEK